MKKTSCALTVAECDCFAGWRVSWTGEGLRRDHTRQGAANHRKRVEGSPRSTRHSRHNCLTTLFSWCRHENPAPIKRRKGSAPFPGIDLAKLLDELQTWACVNCVKD